MFICLFTFRTFKVFLPFLLGHPDSNKEINEKCVSLAVMCPFFLWLLLDFLIASLNFDVLWCHFLHISCVFGSLSFLDMWVYIFYQIGKKKFST